MMACIALSSRVLQQDQGQQVHMGEQQQMSHLMIACGTMLSQVLHRNWSQQQMLCLAVWLNASLLRLLLAQQDMGRLSRL